MKQEQPENDFTVKCISFFLQLQFTLIHAKRTHKIKKKNGTEVEKKNCLFLTKKKTEKTIRK